MQFVKFTEHNENEGESWLFWLQLDGNEEQLRQLQSWIGTFDDDGEFYELDMTPVEEAMVDFAVRHINNTTYINENNKVTGYFICPEVTPSDEGDGIEWLIDHFYKGNIERNFAR